MMLVLLLTLTYGIYLGENRIGRMELVQKGQAFLLVRDIRAGGKRILDSLFVVGQDVRPEFSRRSERIAVIGRPTLHYLAYARYHSQQAEVSLGPPGKLRDTLISLPPGTLDYAQVLPLAMRGLQGEYPMFSPMNLALDTLRFLPAGVIGRTVRLKLVWKGNRLAAFHDLLTGHVYLLEEP